MVMNGDDDDDDGDDAYAISHLEHGVHVPPSTDRLTPALPFNTSSTKTASGYHSQMSLTAVATFCCWRAREEGRCVPRSRAATRPSLCCSSCATRRSSNVVPLSEKGGIV